MKRVLSTALAGETEGIVTGHGDLPAPGVPGA
jgi:hypothetical protein